MEISNKTWIILSISVVVGIIVMTLSFIIMWIKINKIKKENFNNLKNINHLNNKVFKRKNPGELLWDLKTKTKNPLQDEQLEFLINTAIRNEYKTFQIINNNSSYEKETFEKIAKLKISNINPDLIIIFNNPDINNVFDIYYKKIKSQQMIAIVNASYKNKNVKLLTKYLKLIQARHDIIKIGKGIVLIVK